MSIYKCKMCGGTIEYEEGSTVGVCDSCGTRQTLPKTNDDVITNLFNRANNLRLKAEFDKAEEIYERIVQEDDSEAEAHWGLVLCRYGIEYVEDPATHERIPTCHRTLYEPVTKDVDYLAAIDYSDATQQSIYEKEARAIDRIQKGILEIVKNEKPFDVFICYKETDENGKRTIDSTIANDIYYQLTQEGFKVFYAAITLEDKLGQEYEPYIFAALNSAKVMLVLGTKPEYFNAVWVKNEWSRFMKLMKSDRSRLLIPCYRDMNAYDLPEEFAHLQAQDMGKIGFINDVVRGIKKVIEPKNETQQPVVVETMVASSSVEPLLKRAFISLEDGEWDRANDVLEQVLNQAPENAQAYLGKLMAEMRINIQSELSECDKSFEKSINYIRAIRYGDENLVKELEQDVEIISKRLYFDKYTEALKKMDTATDEEELKKLADVFSSMSEYKDSSELAAECIELSEEYRKFGIYKKAVSMMNSAKTAEDYYTVAEIFKSIPGFVKMDIPNFTSSDNMSALCFNIAEEIRKNETYDNAISRMKWGSLMGYESALILFNSICDWKDTNEQIEVCKTQINRLKAKAQEEFRLEKQRAKQQETTELKKKKRSNLSVFAIVLVILVVFSVGTLPQKVRNKRFEDKYTQAVKLYENQEYQEAQSLFLEMQSDITRYRYTGSEPISPQTIAFYLTLISRKLNG